MSKRSKRTWYVLGLVVIACNAGLLWSVQADRAYIRDVALRAAPEGLSDREIVTALTGYVQENVRKCTLEDVQTMPLLRRWNYLYNPFRPGPRSVIEFGGHQLGPCQSNTRALSELLRARGIPFERVVMHDENLRGIHSLLEVEYAGGRGAVSPSYGILYQHPDGRPATIQELREDRELFVANAMRGWQYGWGPDAKAHKLPLPYDLYHFENAYYFNYNWFGPARWIVFRFLRGAFGSQALYWLTRPGWYSYPALTCVVLMDSLLLGALAAWFIVKRRRRRTHRVDPHPASLSVRAGAARAVQSSGPRVKSLAAH